MLPAFSSVTPNVAQSHSPPVFYSVCEAFGCDEGNWFWSVARGGSWGDDSEPTTGFAATYRDAVNAAYDAARTHDPGREPIHGGPDAARHLLTASDPLAPARAVISGEARKPPLWWVTRYADHDGDPMLNAWRASRSPSHVLTLSAAPEESDRAARILVDVVAIATRFDVRLVVYPGPVLDIEDSPHAAPSSPRLCDALRAVLPPPPPLAALLTVMDASRRVAEGSCCGCGMIHTHTSLINAAGPELLRELRAKARRGDTAGAEAVLRNIVQRLHDYPPSPEEP